MSHAKKIIKTLEKEYLEYLLSLEEVIEVIPEPQLAEDGKSVVLAKEDWDKIKRFIHVA